MAIDPMQQALLGQIGQRRSGDQRRSIAASLIRNSPPPAPINNSGAGLAYALTQGLNGFVGGRMMRDADESDQARENQSFERYSNFVNDQRRAQAAELDAARNPPMMQPQMQQQPQAAPGLGGGDFLATLEQRESGGNPNARNPRSTATGAMQFTDGTWREFAAANPQRFEGMAPDQVMGARNDPALSRDAASWYAQRNGQQLSAQGLPAGPAQQGLAHMFGAGGAASLLRADPNAPMASVMPDVVMRANPNLANRTVGQVLGEFDGQFGRGVPAPSNQPQIDAISNEIDRVGRVAANGNPQAQVYLQELRDRRGVLIAQQGRADQQAFQSQQAQEAQRARDAQAQQQREFQAEQARQAAEERRQQAELQSRLAREGREADGRRLSSTEVTLREETEDRLRAATVARSGLEEALRLSSSAAAGPLAETRGYLFGVTGASPQTAVDTAQFSSIMTEQALSMLRSTFGGSPTEGERKILLDMQASATMSRVAREALIKRALETLATREAMDRTRLQEVVSGNYGRVQPGARDAQQPQQNVPVPVQTPEEAARLPRGTPILLPDGREGVVP